MAKKIAMVFSCVECGYQTTQWMGKCPDCAQWNTLIEETKFTTKSESVGNEKAITKAVRVQDVGISEYERVKTGIVEFDRVVGGGVVPGSLTLIGGEPGIGKSTLLTNVLASISKKNLVLYVSGEESVAQIASRAKRLGIEQNNNLLLLNETNWFVIKDQIKKLKPSFVVIDSIQTTMSPEVASAPGSVGQIREVTYELMNYVKANLITCFVIGHITKDGSIAGPKILEHMVDTVIYFEGDQHGHYRMLRSIKNRFGHANEVGIFEMGEAGLIEVRNPSQYFLDENHSDNYGRSLTCVVEGSRTLFVEVQALVVENKFGNGRRTTQGIDTNRLAMLVAVIDKYLEIPISYNDIYLNIVGGLKVQGRETDLSVVASLLSSVQKKVIDNQIVFLGEVGLTGEVRSPVMVEMRLKEMAQLKYKKIITSSKTAQKYTGKFDIELIGIQNIKELPMYL
tara:strand:- start:1807 stop:3165 length:1359 start_codon:yes stop_codon:yes gene_type:complete